MKQVDFCNLNLQFQTVALIIGGFFDRAGGHTQSNESQWPRAKGVDQIDIEVLENAFSRLHSDFLEVVNID